MIRVHSGTRADLPALEPLLAASFGRPDFDLADELDFLPDPVPPNWLMARGEGGEPLGFLRFFPAGNGVQVAELYVPPGARWGNVRETLLHGLVAAGSLAPGERLRFATNPEDVLLRTLLSRYLDVTQVHEYLRPEREVQGHRDLGRTPLTPEDARGAAEVLAVLKPYSPDTLRRLFSAGDLTLTRRDGRVVGAAHTEGRGDGEREVVTFAVRPDARGRGEGARLLHALLTEQPAGTGRLSLQVKEDNHPARRLYGRQGFRELSQGREMWVFARLPRFSS